MKPLCIIVKRTEGPQMWVVCIRAHFLLCLSVSCWIFRTIFAWHIMLIRL